MHLPGFAHHMLRIDDVALHAVVGGEGQPLVLLHGFPQTWWEWRFVMPALARQYKVVAIDLRGAGQSDCPVGGYDKRRMAADVHGVMEALGYSHYAVCGHDIGGMVALALAATERAAVRKLIVLDLPMPGWSRWEGLFSDPRVWHFAFHMKRHLPERLIAGREFEYLAEFFRERAYNQGVFSASEIDIFAKAFARPGCTFGGLEWYRAFPVDHVNALEWKKTPLEMPVLALGGDSRWGPEMIPMMQEFAADVTGGNIAHCGHWMPEEKPEVLITRMLDFLDL